MPSHVALINKLYPVDFRTSKVSTGTFLVTKSDKGWLWHRRLAHVAMRNLDEFQKDCHIVGLPDVVFEKDNVCATSQTRKHMAFHVTQRMWSLPIGHWSYYIWTSLDCWPTLALAATNMV